jgi:high affinity Mn2+ porin
MPATGITRRLATGAVLVALSALPAQAGEPAAAPAYTWTGHYVGGHLGYAWGGSDWTASGTGGATTSGSLDFFLPYDAFKGTGSYFSGFQAGYNHRLPSGLVLGAEADVSAPNTIMGTQTILAPAVGQASYEEKVEYSGTVRARLGFVRNDWLLYATAGYAWTYDRLSRTQLAGSPAGGTAGPGTGEAVHLLRSGLAVGAGLEAPVAANWTATLQYLFTAFGTQGAAFPAAAQRFESDLAIHSLRVGLNYQFGDARTAERSGPAPPKSDHWSVHAQTTYVHQYAFPFRAPYAGANSLVPDQARETWDATFYVGLRLWRGAELWINPEIDQGFGLSGTLGVAGFTSGEAYKLGATYPYTRLPRTFVRQTIDLGGASEKVEAGINQLAGTQTADRLVLTVGKFSVTDVFDTNKYAHDPRADFLNWALIDTATFDYASDAWGYTYGAAVEWYRGPWTLRGGFFDLPITPNNTQLDPSFAQNQWVGEVERRYKLWDQPGKLAITGYLTHGRMGTFADATRLALATGEPADIAAVRRVQNQSGIGFNLEQQLFPELGLFARGGLAGGKKEPFAFTDVDRTLAAGLVVSGKLWGRPDDSIGLGGVVNGITGQHQAFFNAGGLGILVGDGKLPNPGPEKILELYYSLPLLASARLTLDYQFIDNPGYNQDRGPVSVIATRLRAHF